MVDLFENVEGANNSNVPTNTEEQKSSVNEKTERKVSINNAKGGKKNLVQANKKKRPMVSKRATLKIIDTFLSDCEPYEAESIRAIINFSKTTAEVKSMSQVDKRMINHFLYLNYDHYSSYATPDDVREYRLRRAQKLIDMVKRYFEADVALKVFTILCEIAIDKDVVNAISEKHKAMRTPKEAQEASGK